MSPIHILRWDGRYSPKMNCSENRICNTTLRFLNNRSEFSKKPLCIFKFTLTTISRDNAHANNKKKTEREPSKSTIYNHLFICCHYS